jgi:hypothetical protein
VGISVSDVTVPLGSTPFRTDLELRFAACVEAKHCSGLVAGLIYSTVIKSP